MAGIDSNKVYLPSPDQSAATGAIAKAPVGTTMPTDARTALPSAWTTGGYVAEGGLTLNINRSTTTIKDWALSSVRVATTDFETTIEFEWLQTDEFAAVTMFGADNVSKTAATTTAGEILNIGIGPSMPESGAFVFSMKDGDRRVRILAPNAQVTAVGSPTFQPGDAVKWPVTLTCYDDGTGHSVNAIFDDGNTTA